MKKRHRKSHTANSERRADTHFENLIELRERNPQAYARLGEGPNLSVEKFETERLASSFERRAGTEKLLELRERLPKVFAGLSDKTRELVETYAIKKRAYEMVVRSAKNIT